VRFTFYAVTPWNFNFTWVHTLSCCWIEVQVPWANDRISCALVTIPFAVNGGEFCITFYAVTPWNGYFTWIFTLSCCWVEVQNAWTQYRISCAAVAVPLAVNGGEFRFTLCAATTWNINFTWVFTISCCWVEVQDAGAHF
jgi:hypothetical protein